MALIAICAFQVFEVVSALAVVSPAGPGAAEAERNRLSFAQQLEGLLHKVCPCLTKPVKADF